MILKCRICQNEINTNMRQQDGSVVCPFCGTVYRRKAPLAPGEVINQPLDRNHEDVQTKDRDYQSEFVQPSKKPTNFSSELANKSGDHFFPSYNEDLPNDNKDRWKNQTVEDPDQWEEQSIESHEEIPVLSKSSKRKKKSTSNSSGKKGTAKGLVFVLLIAATVVFGFFFATGKIQLPSIKAGNNGIDPNKDVIAVVPDQTLPAKTGYANKTVIVIADDTSIYSLPEESSSIISHAQRGEHFLYITQSSTGATTWYKIKKDETEGWISCKLSVLREEQKTEEVYSITLALKDKYTHNLIAGENSHLCFVAHINNKQKSVSLVCTETGEPIGIMHDDGLNEDEIADDGIYTLGFNINGNRRGKLGYVAKCDYESTNEILIHFYEKPTNENNYYSHSDQISAEINKIEEAYLNENGYITHDRKSEAISAVLAYVIDKYYSGDISEFLSNEDSVCYKDAYSGITFIYMLPEEGIESSGRTSPKVMLCAPYANAKERAIPVGNFGYVRDLLSEELEYRATTYMDENVTPEVFTYIKPNQIFMWNGHGGINLFLTEPSLFTGMEKDIGHYAANFGDYVSGRLGLGNDRVYVTSGYIDKHCGDMTGTLIWIGSCHSAQTDALANSFLSHGASAYFGFSDSVMSEYDRIITCATFYYMVEGIKEENRILTINEALNKAKEVYGADDSEYRKGTDYENENSAHPVIFGNHNYRLEVYDGIMVTPTPTVKPTSAPTPVPTRAPTATPYVDYSKFNIVGKWKSVGSYGFGQAQPGTIVIFDGTYCNFYSPKDTYSVYQSGGKLVLDITSLLFRENLMFDIQIVDKNNIKVVYSPSAITELIRVN